MPRYSKLHALIMSALLFCFLAACQFSQLLTTPDAIGVTPTTLALAPTATAQPTATDVPTFTATPTARPTATATPTATPTSTPRPRTPTPTLMPEAERSKVFGQVWQTIKDRFVYPDQLGKNWDALRREYEPQALAAQSAQEFYEIMGRMVSQLRDGHTYYMSPWVAAERDVVAQGTQSREDIGVLYAIDRGSILLTYVIPDGPAAAAGLQRRERIIEIDGKRTSDAGLLRGPEGSDVKLLVRAPDRTTREVIVKRQSHVVRVLPDAHRLAADSRIGYLHIPTFRPNDMDKEVEKALALLVDGEPLEGLIIDVRSNGGGSRPVLQNILGQFTEGEGGRFYRARGNTPFRLSKGSQYSNFGALPLIVLIDNRSASASELLSGILQFQKRAKVVGVRSAGSLRVTFFHTFSDGSRLGVSEESFKLPNGFDPDQKGITPDVSIDVSWGDYAERDDPHILQAIACLRRECKK